MKVWCSAVVGVDKNKTLDEKLPEILFSPARRSGSWLGNPVDDNLLCERYDLMKWGHEHELYTGTSGFRTYPAGQVASYILSHPGQGEQNLD